MLSRSQCHSVKVFSSGFIIMKPLQTVDKALLLQGFAIVGTKFVYSLQWFHHYEATVFLLPEIYSILSLVPVTAHPPGIALLTVSLSLYSYNG